MIDPRVQRVLDKIIRRDKSGLKRYDVDEQQLFGHLKERLAGLQNELSDLSVYIELMLEILDNHNHNNSQ